ncbi:ComF family protein [soil metagenome]
MVITYLLNIFFPIACVWCGKEKGVVVCETCVKLVSPVLTHVTSADCWCIYRFSDGWVRKALHAVKYGGVAGAAAALVGNVHSLGALSSVLPKGRDIVWLPVPVSKKRLKERGYNQVERIMVELMKHFGGTMCCSVLVKRDRSSLVGKSKVARAALIAGSFRARSFVVPEGAVIVLVDDLVTTGATMQSVRQALHDAGIKVDLTVGIAHEH